MEFNTRMIMALGVVLVYLMMSMYSLINGATIPDAFSNTVSIIVGYYFGRNNLKSTKI